MRKITGLIVSVALAGCATPPPGYTDYAAAIKSMAAQQAAASIAASEAIAEIAKTGSDAARVAAVMMLGLQAQQTKTPVMEPPRDQALQWASVIMPSLTNIGLAYFGAKVAMNASDNNASTTNASYGAVTASTLAGYSALTAFKPVPIDFVGLIKTLPPSQVVTIGGDGVVGSGTVSKPVTTTDTCTTGATATGTSGSNNC